MGKDKLRKRDEIPAQYKWNMQDMFATDELWEEEADKVVGFEFVWFTDGMGWISARNNLKETFDKMEYIYNINDLKNDIIKQIIK